MKFKKGFFTLSKSAGKSANHKGAGSQYISDADVERAFVWYCDGIAAPEIARRLGRNTATIDRFIRVGIPTRRVEAFRQRRERIRFQASRELDDKLVNTLVRAQEIACKAAEAVGERVIKRVSNADILENPALYADGNHQALSAAHASAINPEVKDLKDILTANARLESVNRHDATTVNVMQNQSQQQEVDYGGIDFVRDNIKKIQDKYNDDEAKEIACLVKNASLGLEKVSDT